MGVLRQRWSMPQPDPWLWGPAAALLGLGLVMVTSASIGIASRQWGEPLHFFYRQGAYAAVGLLAGWLVLRTPLRFWERTSGLFFPLAILVLTLVLVPGLGREVNGSMRWLDLGLVRVQASEIAKLCVIVYFAGYLVRRSERVRSELRGFVLPLALLVVVDVLLLLEPDFGAAVVLTIATGGMLLLGGVRWRYFLLLLLTSIAAMTALVLYSPYRLARVTSFLDPWADPFNSGFQLTQALIAIGSGGWFGAGLGGSIQKLFYLPEAHTDFLFAVLAEELGLVGVTAVLALYAILIFRAFGVGTWALDAGHRFGGYLAYGIGFWLGLQAVINMGVNMGLLPTKGLTLPLLSYGGSSLVVTCVALALLMRIEWEVRTGQSRPEGSNG